jgi:hypothetical protein
VLASCFCWAFDLFAVQTTYTFYPRQDTYVDGTITGPNNFNTNFGVNTNLTLKTTTNVLIAFSQDELTLTLRTQHVVSATLQMYIETNFNNWRTGTYVDAHRLSVDWVETGATWNCANDSDTSNLIADCDDISLLSRAQLAEIAFHAHRVNYQS